MTETRKAKAAAWLLLGLACTLATSTAPAQEDANEEQIQLIILFVSDAERETRTVGLQAIRDEVPGEAATKRFAALLPKLQPEARAELLEALGDRGDAAARPAVLEMLGGEDEPVRTSALKALGTLGGAADVPLLVEKAATGSKLEKGAARLSLVRLRGDDVNQAIVASVDQGSPDARVELLGVLAARGAKETLPTVIAGAEDPEPSVRIAALEALRFLADETHVETIVKILKAAKDDQQRRKAELALLVVCSRGGQACAEAIIAGLTDASADSRTALLRALARSGGPKALDGVVARLQDDEELVRDQAVRMLSTWPDPAAAEHLATIARKGDNVRHRVLAIRGMVRLAGPQDDRPADLKILAETLSLANRPQEKRLVLGVLGGAATPQALELVTSAIGQSVTADEAALAAVMIAEKIEEGDKGEIRAAMKKALAGAKSPKIRQRAQKVLDAL